MASSTIFFDGFGPWGGEHVGEIDPLFWETTGTVSLSEYRADRGSSNDFMGYSFGSVAKLTGHYTDAGIATLKAKNFPATFTSNNTGFGVGFFTNKIATDSADRPNTSTDSEYAVKVVSLQNTLTAGSTSVDVLTLEAIHISPTGYGGSISSPKVGLRVKQTVSGATETLGYFTFDVFGSPWYVDNSNSISTTLQRTVDAYDYKYGGLYVEICVVPDPDPNDSVTKPYSMQVKVNGMNLTVGGTVDDKKLYIKNNFGTNINTTKFFNSMTFYGYRKPVNTSNDPWTGLNAGYLYNTYIDNVYVIEGAAEQDCLLGPTTKVFNIVPKNGASGARANTDWQGFTLNWQTSNDNLESNLKDNNGDGSYVYTETSGSVLAMSMAQTDGSLIPSGINYSIGGIKVTNSVRKSNKDTSFTNVWGTGTNPVSMSGIGTDFSVTNNHYEYKNQYFLTNPVTATGWTFSDVNNGKFGIKKTS